MKKFIAVLLTVAIFVTIAMPASADFPGTTNISTVFNYPTTAVDGNTTKEPITFVPVGGGTTAKTTAPYEETTTNNYVPPTNEEPSTFVPITTKPTMPPPVTDEDPTTGGGNISGSTKVARISLCTYIHKIHFGHCWVYVENISNQTLKVGYYDLPPGEGVSLGSFFTTRYDGGGIYYNIEAYTVNEFDSKGYFSITRDATLNNINSLTTYLKTFNWWDPIVMNCAGFALGAWMSAGKFIIPIPIPLIVMAQLFVMGVDMDMPMYNPGRNRVYKQKGNGLVIVSDKSANKPLSMEN